jgi:hypothetical protein
MPNVNFNPENSRPASGGSLSSNDISYSNSSLIASRSAGEGPDSDTFSRNEEKDVPKGLKNAVINLIKGWMGVKSDNIKFLDAPIKKDDGTYIISQEFSAASLDEASDSASKLYEIQKGSIQRKTGELFQGISAEPAGAGQYIAIAEGIL